MKVEQTHTEASYFEKFSATTVIRVFSFINKSAFIGERLFWVGVLVFFSSTTIWSVTETIRNFLSEPTASKVLYMRNHTAGMHYDDANICFEMQSEKFSKLYDRQIDDVIRELKESPDFLQTMTKKVDQANEIEDKRSESMLSILNNLDTFESPANLLDAYNSFDKRNFDLFTPNEVAFLGITTSLFVRLIDIEADPQSLYSEPPSTATMKLHQALVERTVDFADLFYLTGRMTCALLQIRIIAVHYDMIASTMSYETYNFCKRFIAVNYFGVSAGGEIICYKLGKGEESPIHFWSPFDSVILTLHIEALYKEHATDLHGLAIYLEGATAAGAEQALSSPRLHENQIIDFSLETVSILLDLRRRRCTEKWTRKGNFIDCVYWCRIESIVSACNCMPLFRLLLSRPFAELPEGLESCAVKLANVSSIDEKCQRALSANYSSVLISNCSQECKDNCETFLFISSVRADGMNVSTTVSLKATKFVYEKVDEYLTMDFKGFIAALGGNLSLYLGASFLALIHIIVFFVRIPFERVCGRGKQQAVGDGHNYCTSEQVRLLFCEVSSLKEQLHVLQERGDPGGLQHRFRSVETHFERHTVEGTSEV